MTTPKRAASDSVYTVAPAAISDSVPPSARSCTVPGGSDAQGPSRRSEIASWCECPRRRERGSAPPSQVRPDREFGGSLGCWSTNLVPGGSGFLGQVASEDALESLQVLCNQPTGLAGDNTPCNPAEQTVEQIDS